MGRQGKLLDEQCSPLRLWIYAKRTPRWGVLSALNKGISGFRMVFLTGLEEGLGPFGMVHGVGIELSFQSHAGALTIVYATLAIVVQEIACVELDTGAISGNGHDAAGFGVFQNGAGVAENLEIVVIAALQVQRFVIGVDVLTDGLGCPEIEGGADDAAQFAGGDIGGIVGVEEPAGDGKNLVHGLIGLFVAGQVEIAVVGHVEHGVLIADAVINDGKGAAVFQPVGDLHGGVAGETLIAIGADKAEGDGIGAMGNHIPQPLVSGVGAGVEVVAVFVVMEGDGLVVHDEAGLFHAVGIPGHGGTQEGTAGEIAGNIVTAQNHVGKAAILVRNPQGNQSGTTIGELCGNLTTGYGVQMSLLARRQNAEFFFHGICSFHFLQEKAFRYVDLGFLNYTIFPYRM